MTMTDPLEDARMPAPAQTEARPRVAALMGIYGVVGVLATAALLWLFVTLADEVGEAGALTRTDHAVGRWLEAHGTESGETIFNWITQLGSTVLGVSVVAAILYFAWRRRRRQAVALALASTSSVLVDNALKMLFHRGRPETATEFITRQSWSFPSGHAMNSMVCYGFLAFLLLQHVQGRWRRAGVVIGAALLIGLIGFSRLYLGVHYLSDVGGGWIAGAAWLIACVLAYRVALRGTPA